MKRALIYFVILAIGIAGIVLFDSSNQSEAAIDSPGSYTSFYGCSSTVNALARLKKSKRFHEKFSNNSCNWDIKHPSNVFISGGEMVTMSPSDTRNKAILPLGLSVFTDYEIEVTVKWKSGNRGAGNGFEYISCSAERKDFTINAQGSISASTYHVSERKYVDEIAWTPTSAVKHGQTANNIKVRKEAATTTFYVNGTKVGSAKFGTNCDTFDVTLFTDSHTAHYDDLKIKIIRWHD